MKFTKMVKARYPFNDSDFRKGMKEALVKDMVESVENVVEQCIGYLKHLNSSLTKEEIAEAIDEMKKIVLSDVVE